jgi:hypothetical protein
MRGEKTIVCLMLVCGVVLAAMLFAATTANAQGFSIGGGVSGDGWVAAGTYSQSACPTRCAPAPAPVCQPQYREYVSEVVQPVIRVLPPRYEYSQPQCPPQPACQPRCVPQPAPAPAYAPNQYYNGYDRPLYGGAHIYPAQPPVYGGYGGGGLSVRANINLGSPMPRYGYGGGYAPSYSGYGRGNYGYQQPSYGGYNRGYSGNHGSDGTNWLRAHGYIQGPTAFEGSNYRSYPSQQRSYGGSMAGGSGTNWLRAHGYIQGRTSFDR